MSNEQGQDVLNKGELLEWVRKARGCVTMVISEIGSLLDCETLAKDGFRESAGSMLEDLALTLSLLQVIEDNEA